MRRVSSGPSAPKNEIDWTPEILRVRTATAAPAATDAPAAKGQEPAPAAGAAKAETVLRVRGLELPRGLERPVLLYFHWPHEDGAKGKEVRKFCTGPIDDDVFCRAARLFYCVEVNAKESDARILEELKVQAPPALMVCRPDLSVVWRCEDRSVGGSRLAAAVTEMLRKEFPAFWKRVQEDEAGQAKEVVEAESLLKKGKVEDATRILEGILGSDVRIGKSWDDAFDLLKKARTKDEAGKTDK